MKSAFDLTYKFARRLVIGMVGATVLLVGVVMLVTPGPAFIVIPIGLGILGLEFAWARRWLAHVRERISEQGSRIRASRAESRRRNGA